MKNLEEQAKAEEADDMEKKWDLNLRTRMVELKRDRKARNLWLITTTDSEGFHRQLPISHEDMAELVKLWKEKGTI